MISNCTSWWLAQYKVSATDLDLLEVRLTGIGHGDLQPYTVWTISHGVHDNTEEVGGQLLQTSHKIDSSQCPRNVNDCLIPIDFVHIEFEASELSIEANGAGWWLPGDFHCCIVEYCDVEVGYFNAWSCGERKKGFFACSAYLSQYCLI